MTRITIQIVEKAEPAMGKKRGRIKDAQGLIYQIPPALLQMTNVGSTYEIDYKDDEFNGNKFRVVESLVPALAYEAKISGGPLHQQYPMTPPASQQVARPQSQASTQPILTEYEKQIDISVLSIFEDTKWGEKIPSGDRVALEHVLRTIRLAWIGHKKSRIETGRQSYDEEFPE